MRRKDRSRVDPDSAKLISREQPEAPHEASRFDAGTGQGTVSGPPSDAEFQERPILDGSTQGPGFEASVPNPYRGHSDPAQMVQQPALNNTHMTRWVVSAAVSAVIIWVICGILFVWNPLWCVIGMVVALAGLIAMLFVRAASGRRFRLRLAAIILWGTWIVAIVIIVGVLVGSVAAG